MIQEFDMPARWRSFLTEYLSEEIHGLAVMWPRKQSLEVSFHVLETFDSKFALDILARPDKHLDAANTALRLLLQESGSDHLAFVRVVGLPSDHSPDIRDLRSDHIGGMVGLDSVVIKIYIAKN